VAARERVRECCRWPACPNVAWALIRYLQSIDNLITEIVSRLKAQGTSPHDSALRLTAKMG